MSHRGRAKFHIAYLTHALGPVPTIHPLESIANGNATWKNGGKEGVYMRRYFKRAALIVIIGTGTLTTQALRAADFRTVASEITPDMKDLYVQARFAEIKALPKMDSETMGLAAAGENLKEIERDPTGMWVHVRSLKGEGWVSRFLITERPVESMVEGARDVASLRKKSKAGPAADTAGSIRANVSDPFSPAKRNALGTKFDLDAIEKLNEFKVSPKALKAFQKRAKLSTN